MKTVYELAQNWLDNDRTGEYSQRKITLEEAAMFVGWMDPEDDLPEDLTPERFQECWNSMIDSGEAW